MGDAIIVERAPEGNFLEHWRFNGRGKLIIRKIGEFGRQTSAQIHGGTTFHLTPAERRLNQQVVAKPEYDPFTNGQCEALLLDETDPDYIKLTENANVIKRDDTTRIFKTKGEHFKARLERITSASAIRTLLEMAEATDSTATVPQWRMLQARLESLETELQHVSPRIQEAIERGEDVEVDGTAMPKPIQLGT